MPSKPKKIPMRMCVGCREMKEKKQLLRVVKSQEGVISIDMKGKSPGRGAYVCRDPGCLEKAVKQRQLERALETKISPEIYEILKEQMTTCE